MIAHITKGALALTVLSSLVLLGTPTFAVEPDVNSPAGPELPLPARIDLIFSKTTNLERSSIPK